MVSALQCCAACLRELVQATSVLSKGLLERAAERRQLVLDGLRRGVVCTREWEKQRQQGSSNRMASTGSACSAGKTWIQAGYLCSFSALLNHGQIQQCASQCSFSSTRCHQTSSRFCKDRCSSYGDVADTSTSCTSGVGLAHCPSLSSGMATVHRHQSDGQLERNT